MVNEYEKEGRKSVWILMNTASRMQMGNSIRSCFEYGIQAVIELADYYLDKNCLLGFSLFNDDYPSGSIGFLRGRSLSSTDTELLAQRYIDARNILPPDSGRHQFIRLRNMMMQITASLLNPSLSEAIQQAKNYTKNNTPLYIIITVIDTEHMDELSNGLMEINQLTHHRTPQPQAMVIHLLGYELVNTSTQAAHLRFIEDTQRVNKVKESAYVLQWNPRRELLSEAIIAQVNR